MKADSNNHSSMFRDAVLTLAGIGVILALLRMSATIAAADRRSYGCFDFRRVGGRDFTVERIFDLPQWSALRIQCRVA